MSSVSLLGGEETAGDTVLKVKEALSSILKSAKKYDLLAKNPVEGIIIPKQKRVNRKKEKPVLPVEEFYLILAEIQEPYATMWHTAYFSGLRPSELIGLKIEDVQRDSITVREAYCRGDWKETKTPLSAATISVPRAVYERIKRLRDLDIEYRSGGQGAKRCVKGMRSLERGSLVFQSLKKGGPMNDGNILRRHIRPAAVKLGIDPKKVTWQALRRSYGTWLNASGANVKDVQAQMRHAKPDTTYGVYVQRVPESQKRAVDRMMQVMERQRKQGGKML
ncbi:MAG TPA: site-specific integrase [Candidatus Sulfotelmatobacter sp.]|nr:site-specific integrase [Candidatus Sulfotelmatobacter sp.]